MQKIKHTSPIHQLDKLLQSTEGLRSKTIMDKKTVKKKREKRKITAESAITR